ncbi:E3 ubiquitin-protein ligase RFI2-like [Salvia divinorum]|uniref:E3 ubiquitin-protein ligase RFI2-like n=1 Tax=Salvia divinorum TaxID=28513 RepID=A0ABD1GWB9_SALDI
MSSRLCSICLNTVVDDNSRGKAELICGHLFHLDCIGSEFNYRSEMKCPNCRVVENGEWLIPDEEMEEDDDYLVHVRRLELHIYTHGGRGVYQTTRGDEERRRLAMIAPTMHYNHNNVVHPPHYGANTHPATLLRDYYGYNSTQQISRPDAGEVMAHYRRTRFHYNPPISTIVNNESRYRRRGEITSASTNRPGNSSLPSYGSYNGPSLELTLTTNPSEDRSQEEQHGRHEGRSGHGTNFGSRY